MLHRTAVIVSGLALAFLSAFVWAPHVHLHADEGVRHAHLTPHEHQHDQDPARHQDREHDDTILDADAFVSTTALKAFAPSPVRAPEIAGAELPVAKMVSITADQPRAHGPPARDWTAPRPPPAPTPAF